MPAGARRRSGSGHFWTQATGARSPLPALPGTRGRCGHDHKHGPHTGRAPPGPGRGCRDVSLSRWLWLVKWLLLIPHFIVLVFLWIAFMVVTVVAFFAILFTGRYPRAIFDFNVGVLRWSWRVAYYGYSALGTDRYPPFTLADVPDYPARLDVAYPERLSRGLVLVKWWLLAIPHYLVVGALRRRRRLVTWRCSDDRARSTSAAAWSGCWCSSPGSPCCSPAATPTGIFDLVLGHGPLGLRVAAYVALMTDDYPPFRLDQGGSEPTPAPLPLLPTDGDPAAPTPAAVG